MKRVLIVSPHFPPVNAPDHQRVRMSLPFFSENGWIPTVLAVDAAWIEGTLDPLLAATIPPEIAVHRVSALPARLTRLVGLGNIAYRAWFQLSSAGAKLLSQQKFDLVYFSTTQFVVTVLGDKWLRLFGVPYVVDLQDPWRTDYYDRPGAPPPPGGMKYRFARWQANRLEEPAWRAAAGFVSVSERYLEQLRTQYRWFETKPAAVIPFGISESDFAFARQSNDLVPAFRPEAGTVQIVAVGAIGPIMEEALRMLFTALRTLRTTAPTLAARLRFHFVGTSYAAGSRAQPSVLPIAAEFGVGDLVREQTERVGYFVAIKTMLAADAIFIPGSNDPAYQPSKIAACFLAERPTLVIGPADSVLERSVNELGFAIMARCPSPDAEQRVIEFLQALANQAPLRAPGRATERFETMHTARTRTRQQCELFERALRG